MVSKFSSIGQRVIWLSIFVLLTFYSAEANAVVDSGDILDNVLARYSAAASTWATYITSCASWLFWTLTIISMVWTFGMMALSKADLGEFFAEFVRFTIFTGFFWWLLTNGPAFATAIMDSLRTIAGTASGLGPSLTPSGIADIGFDIFYKVLDRSSIWSPIDSLTGLVISLIILIVLALIGVNMLLLLVSGWILAFAGIFFLGFGGSRWTSDLAISYYRTVLSVAAQLFTMVLLVGIGKSFVDQYYAAMDAGLSLKELAVMLIVSVVLLSLVTKIPPLIGNLAMGGGTGSLGHGLGVGAAIGATALGTMAIAKSGGLLVGGAANVLGGAQAVGAAASQASENVAEGTDIFSRMAGAFGGNNGNGSGSSGNGSPLASAMDGANTSSSSSSSGNASVDRSQEQSGAVAAAKIAVDAAAILGSTTTKMGFDKLSSATKGAFKGFQQRASRTLGGQIASAIRAKGSAPVASSDQSTSSPTFADNDFAGGEQTSASNESAVASNSEPTIASADPSFSESVFEEYQIGTDEFDAEAEVAAFRDRETQPV